MPKLGAGFGKVGEDPNEDKDYLSTICYLKKHHGETWRQVVETDPEYVLWVLTESDVRLGHRLRDELTWALEERE